MENLTLGDKHPNFGKTKETDEGIKRTSDKLSGRKQPWTTFRNKVDNPAKRPEVREKISKSRSKYVGEKHPMFGKKRPDVSERNRLQTGDKNPMWGKKRPGEKKGLKARKNIE
jgi:hypothetical protein